MSCSRMPVYVKTQAGIPFMQIRFFNFVARIKPDDPFVESACSLLNQAILRSVSETYSATYFFAFEKAVVR